MTNREEKQKHPLWSDFWGWAERNHVHPSHLDLCWDAFLAGAFTGAQDEWRREGQEDRKDKWHASWDSGQGG